MPLVGFEPTISAGERPQTDALNWAAIWTGTEGNCQPEIFVHLKSTKKI
jgi:hypothetical protein